MNWKTIKSRPNYLVNEIGEIKNNKTGRILKQHLNTSGYMTVMLGRKTSPLYVHRIVAEEFIENINNLPQVDHVNGNKLDNNIKNLRWLTVSDNCYGYGYENRIGNRKKKIIANNGLSEILFDSRNECAEYFKCDKSQIKYDIVYKKGNKKGWVLKLVKDIV